MTFREYTFFGIGLDKDGYTSPDFYEKYAECTGQYLKFHTFQFHTNITNLMKSPPSIFWENSNG